MLAEAAGHLTYILLAISYLVRDIVWLRIIAIPASICSILFSYFAPAEPIWLIVNWNLFFLAVNTFQLAYIYRCKRQIVSDQHLSELAQFLSPSVAPQDVIQLANWAERMEFEAEKILLAENEEAEYLYLIVDGGVEIYRDHELLAASGIGSFLGEISFLSKQKCSATAITNQNTVAYRWEQTALRRNLANRISLNLSLQQVLSLNLSRLFTEREQTPARVLLAD